MVATMDTTLVPKKPTNWRLLITLAAAVAAARSPVMAAGIAATGTIWGVTGPAAGRGAWPPPEVQWREVSHSDDT